MNAKTFFSDRPIAYHPILAKVCGSVTAALFLSQVAYWNDKGFDKDGWIYKTEVQMEEETGMSRKEQENARKRLVWCGILKEERRGIPAKMWYLIDWEALTALLDEFEKTRLSNKLCETDNQVVPNVQSSSANEAISTEITSQSTSVVEQTTTPEDGNEPTDSATPAEKLVEQSIFGLGWKDRTEIRAIAEKDVGLVSLTQALGDFRTKVGSGEYRANWSTLRKFWNNTLSTNVLRGQGPPPGETPEYQKNIKWEHFPIPQH